MSARVLLIDDDELIAGSLRSYLLMSGCEVDVAPEPSAAQTLMEARQYGVVLIDPYLTGGVPGENGELLERICAVQPGASIIVLTAYTSPALAAAAAACKVAALLTKPQSVVFLKSLIRSASAVGADTPQLTRSGL